MSLRSETNNTDFHFSHVFEDSSIEEQVLKELYKTSQLLNNDPLKVLLIASGGCTLMKTAHLFPNMQIDVVDYNINQISLVVFKLLVADFINSNVVDNCTDISKSFTSNVVENCNDILKSSTSNVVENYNDILKSFIIKINNNDCTTAVELYKNIIYNPSKKLDTICYQNLLTTLINKYNHLDYSKYLNYWNDHLDLLVEGVGVIGKLEKTFKNLMNSGLDFESFELNFDKNRLRQEFGDDSIELTTEGFVNHFHNIIQKYKECSDNDFYYLIKHGIPNDNNLISTLNKINLNNIKFHHSELSDFMSNNKDSYDLIQLSNVTDWMKTSDNIKKLLDNCCNRLKVTGTILLRQLNGSYDLPSLINDGDNGPKGHLTVHDNLYIKTNSVVDKSYFYKNVFLIKKNIKLFIKDLMVDINKNKYMYNLVTRSINLGQFYSTQKIFHIAVNNWISVLIKFLDILPEQDRLILLDNINDEMGNGVLEKTHSNTFQHFLNSILKNLNNSMVDEYDPKCVNEFVNNLYFIVANKNITYIAAYLGAIEYAYIFISNVMLSYINEHNIIQYHYELHEELDTKHSDDLFNIAMNNNISDNDFYHGLIDGYKNFMILYEDLYNLIVL